jgi:pleiotropic regulator 1
MWNRLITVECDKTIKMWREDETATPESHPIDTHFKTLFESQRF